MADDAAKEGEGGRLRVNITVRPITLRYLQQLADLGIFGDDKTSVSFRLVEDGIRRALEGGIIHPETPEPKG
jgi:hypothetical protein